MSEQEVERLQKRIADALSAVDHVWNVLHQKRDDDGRYIYRATYRKANFVKKELIELSELLDWETT